DRKRIAQILPVFIGRYLTNDMQKSFDFRLIESLHISDAARQALKREVSGLAFPINRHHPLVVNIVRFFRSSSLLDSPCVQEALSDYLV
ncbi:MAG: aminobenzoate oxygenase, partial [Pseudomonas sp.]|nr:aminobenzoate oxygenase [Pseudomonas sp.]